MKKLYTLALGICTLALSNAQVSDLGSYVQVTDVSNAGIAVGNVSGVAYFMWSEPHSGKIIGEAGENGVAGNANISEDGSTVAMSLVNPDKGNKVEAALYDVKTENVRFLGGLAGTSGTDISSNWGLSSNGKNAVGLGWASASKAEAFIWKEGQSIVSLGSTVATRSSRADAVNNDGVVVGWQDSSNGNRQGAIWRNGVQQLLQDNNGNILGPASAVSADGKTVAGSNFMTNEAYIWHETEGTILLQSDDPYFNTGIAAMSDDGKIILGLIYDPFDGGILMGEGFIWTKETGKVNLNDYVASLGYDNLNITFSVPTGISPDGKYIGGIGVNLEEEDAKGFLIKLPGATELATQQVTKNDKISVFPNPVKDIVTIKSSDTVQSIDVYSPTGQLVFSTTTVADNKLDLSTLSKGVYLLKAKTNKGLQTTKIIKN